MTRSGVISPDTRSPAMSRSAGVFVILLIQSVREICPAALHRNKHIMQNKVRGQDKRLWLQLPFWTSIAAQKWMMAGLKEDLDKTRSFTEKWSHIKWQRKSGGRTSAGRNSIKVNDWTNFTKFSDFCFKESSGSQSGFQNLLCRIGGNLWQTSDYVGNWRVPKAAYLILAYLIGTPRIITFLNFFQTK